MTLQNKIENINKELDIHKLMLGEILELPDILVPDNKGAIVFPKPPNNYEYYTEFSNKAMIFNFINTSSVSENVFISTTFSSSTTLFIPEYLYFSQKKEMVLFDKDFNRTKFETYIKIIKLIKQPIKINVIKMINSTWYKEEYLKGKTPTFKSEMSVYDYYVNNILDKEK